MIRQGSGSERQRILWSRWKPASSRIDDLHMVAALWLGYRALSPSSHLLARLEIIQFCSEHEQCMQ